ncbi:MAG: response regulator transcription factor [Actinomycetota bacterium]|nr:response regulator transcription factor [Actinomycetota bacterium]
MLDPDELTAGMQEPVALVGSPPAFRTVVADDVADLRMMLRVAVEMSRHFDVVGEAGDGREAVRLARELQPDLLLLDLAMPVQDGIQSLPQVLEASPRTIVVVLSGFESRRLAPLALHMGATAYLEKGISPSQLVSSLLAIMDKAGSRPASIPAS